jgi:CTP:molybdopterin cytidylyltransferase MocA
MGRPKALLPFRGGTFLSVLAGTLGSYCSPVVAVFGFDGEAVAARAPEGVIPVINRDYRLGMLTSLQAGLRALGAYAGPVLFTLVDHPAVEPATVELLFHMDAGIAIPRLAGRRGHPVLLPPDIADEFLAEPVTSKVRDVIDRHAARIRYVDVDDPGICDDVDDPEIYQALLRRESGPA